MAESAGIVLYRRTESGVEVLIAHPGGPFWAARDKGWWSIPKGEIAAGEAPLVTAQRELAEELGTAFEQLTPPLPLGSVRQRGGKVVHAWAIEGDVDPDRVTSNTFSMEWPPRSGTLEEFPEIDRVEWVAPHVAKKKLNPAQSLFVDRLIESLQPEP